MTETPRPPVRQANTYELIAYGEEKIECCDVGVLLPVEEYQELLAALQEARAERDALTAEVAALKDETSTMDRLIVEKTADVAALKEAIHEALAYGDSTRFRTVRPRLTDAVNVSKAHAEKKSRTTWELEQELYGDGLGE